MGKPSAPAAPDPVATASAQTGTNVSTAIANANLGNVDQVTPNGNLSYDQTGSYSFKDPTSGKTYDIPRYTATTTLSPGQQAIKDQTDAAQLNLAGTANQQSAFLQDYLGKGMDLSGLPTAGDASKITAPDFQQFGQGPQLQGGIANAGDVTKSYGTDYADNVKQVQDALLSRINPQLQQQQTSLETQLSNQGIKLGSAAYDRAMQLFGQQKNDAQYGAIINAGQEQSRLAGLAQNQAQFQNAAQQQQYNQNLGDATFGNTAAQQGFENANTTTTNNNQVASAQNSAQLAQFNAEQSARQQALQEQFASRNQPINEISALLSGSQVSQPNFINTKEPTIPTTDYAGIVQQNFANQNAQYNSALGSWNSTIGGLFGLGAAGIKASDRRLKTDIKKVAETGDGQNVYQYRYKAGGPMQLGLMAQEVEKKHPEAVIEMSSGYKAVDYNKAFGLGKTLLKEAA
jgi:hypothetical protein